MWDLTGIFVPTSILLEPISWQGRENPAVLSCSEMLRTGRLEDTSQGLQADHCPVPQPRSLLPKPCLYSHWVAADVPLVSYIHGDSMSTFLET